MKKLLFTDDPHYPFKFTKESIYFLPGRGYMLSLFFLGPAL